MFQFLFTQNLIINIPGNEDPMDGIIQFSISINEGTEFVIGDSTAAQYFPSVEVTIMEDDGKLYPIGYNGKLSREKAFMNLTVDARATRESFLHEMLTY